MPIVSVVIKLRGELPSGSGLKFYIDLLISGIININFTIKNANMLRPSQVLKLMAMMSPKNAPAKCSAK